VNRSKKKVKKRLEKTKEEFKPFYTNYLTRLRTAGAIWHANSICFFRISR